MFDSFLPVRDRNGLDRGRPCARRRRSALGRTAGYVATLALTLGGGLLVAGCSKKAAAAAGDAADVAVVERRDLDIQAEASGTIEPIDSVQVKSQASGAILKLNVATGDKVKQGELLAEIDPRDVRNAYEQAKADLDVAQAQIKVDSAQLKREEKLLKAGVVTEQEYEQSVLTEANAEASLVKARNNLELAQKKLTDATVMAPMSGTVITQNVVPGQIIASATNNVSGGTTLLTLADLSTMQVRALVDETDIGRVEPGQPVDVTVDAYSGRHFQGQVYKIEPQAVVDQNVTMFPVLIRLDNGEGLLKPGMNSEVTIQIANRPNAITVPNSSVVSMRDAMAAAAVVGLDPNAVRQAMTAGPDAKTVGQTADVPADCQGLRQKIRSAGGFQNLSEADRSLLERCRSSFRGGRAGSGGADVAVAGGPNGDVTTGSMASPTTSGQPRPAMVFVQTPSGPQAKRVTLGLNNWDYTEVLNGVQPGEKVILISIAKLQQQQEQLQQRIQNRGMFGNRNRSNNRSNNRSGGSNRQGQGR